MTVRVVDDPTAVRGFRVEVDGTDPEQLDAFRTLAGYQRGGTLGSPLRRVGTLVRLARAEHADRGDFEWAAQVIGLLPGRAAAREAAPTDPGWRTLIRYLAVESWGQEGTFNVARRFTRPAFAGMLPANDDLWDALIPVAVAVHSDQDRVRVAEMMPKSVALRVARSTTWAGVLVILHGLGDDDVWDVAVAHANLHEDDELGERSGHWWHPMLSGDYQHDHRWRPPSFDRLVAFYDHQSCPTDEPATDDRAGRRCEFRVEHRRCREELAVDDGNQSMRRRRWLAVVDAAGTLHAASSIVPPHEEHAPGQWRARTSGRPAVRYITEARWQVYETYDLAERIWVPTTDCGTGWVDMADTELLRSVPPRCSTCMDGQVPALTPLRVVVDDQPAC